MYFSKKSLEVLQADYETMSERCQRLLDAYAAYKYTNARAQEFAMQGFARRLQTIIRCVINTFELLPPEQADLPTREERHDAEINIQAFVFNAFGSIDNLAWIWLMERGITQKDGSAIPSTRVGLSKKNRFVRSSFSSEFRKYLQSLDQWFDHLENFRHALAHRIPLYIPPYVVLDSKQAKYKEIEERMMKTTTREEYERLLAEQ